MMVAFRCRLLPILRSEINYSISRRTAFTERECTEVKFKIISLKAEQRGTTSCSHNRAACTLCRSDNRAYLYNCSVHESTTMKWATVSSQRTFGHNLILHEKVNGISMGKGGPSLTVEWNKSRLHINPNRKTHTHTSRPSGKTNDFLHLLLNWHRNFAMLDQAHGNKNQHATIFMSWRRPRCMLDETLAGMSLGYGEVPKLPART